MQELYNDTILTPLRVAKSTGFLDWETQPAQFKSYPKFLYRYYFNEIEALKVAELSRCVTEYQTLQGKPYYRLNTPSAGNLHPLELYVQIRGVKGVISGIYHIDPKEESIVLIGEIENDGIEHAVGINNRFNGMLFLVSIVPFRSEWKYSKRSIRYCYLDVGHQLGALIASAEVFGQKCTVLSDIDRGCLDHLFGFGEDEFSCISIVVGEETQKSVKPLRKSLMKVTPVDYIEGEQSVRTHLSNIDYSQAFSLMPITTPLSVTSIFERRSARQFVPEPLSNLDSFFFMDQIKHAPAGIDPFVIVLRSENYKKGLYSLNETLCEGDYHREISHLMVDQNFISNAAFVIIFTSEKFTPEALIQSGAMVQNLNLYAQDRDLGCTGIGAFYDTKIQKFLDTKSAIIYACAIGVVV